MRNKIVLGSNVIIAVTLLFFWLTPVYERNDYVSWGSLFLFVICVVALSLSFSTALRQWRGLGAIALMHVVGQAWLQWQWGLWDSPIVLVRNLNVVAILVVFGTLIAMLISLSLLLISQDASAISLAAVWLGCPLLFILTMVHYGTFERFSVGEFRENIVLLTPVCLLWFLAVAGGIAFFGQMVWLVIKEISGRELGRG